MAYTTFSQTKNDQLKEPMFFGQPVNVARYDQQKYDIFEKLIEKQLSFFWRPEEVDVSRDRIDYQALPEHEKHIFISNLKYQTLLDSIQGRSPNVALLPLISIPELETWVETWAFSETIHSRSYTHIIRNIVNDPSVVFDDIVTNEQIQKRAEGISDGSANNLTHKTFEAIQYYLLKASNELAKEQGACPWFNETTYAKGILPIDTYKKDLDTIANEPLHYDWEALRESIKTHGLRNSTLSALMPSETSSQISNATNGIEPPRGYVSIKASKDGILRQVVPDYEHLHDAYELLWEMPGNDGYLQLVGIMQKFIDQSISANTNYDPSRFPSGKVPMQQLLKDLLTAYKFGVKTLYYQNTRDGAEDAQDDLVPSIQDDGCESGACKI